MYVYRAAHVARLPHSAEKQRHARHMHRISRRSARPGDLVFYLNGLALTASYAAAARTNG